VKHELGESWFSSSQNLARVRFLRVYGFNCSSLPLAPSTSFRKVRPAHRGWDLDPTFICILTLVKNFLSGCNIPFLSKIKSTLRSKNIIFNLCTGIAALYFNLCITMLIFILSISLVLLLYVFRKNHKTLRLPPGPSSIPLLGYLSWIDPIRPYVSLTKLAKKYGPICGLQMGSVLRC